MQLKLKLHQLWRIALCLSQDKNNDKLQLVSLDWSDCLVVSLLSATHFRKSGHVRLIRGCFSFSQYFRTGVFSSLSPLPLTRPISSSLREVSTWRFREQIARSKKTPGLQARYVPLASQGPYPIIVHFVANCRPHISNFWANM